MLRFTSSVNIGVRYPCGQYKSTMSSKMSNETIINTCRYLLTKFNPILMDLRRFKTSWHSRKFLPKSTTNSYVGSHSHTH